VFRETKTKTSLDVQYTDLQMHRTNICGEKAFNHAFTFYV